MHQGFMDYLVYTQMAEHERTIAAHRREREALAVRPPRRRFQVSFRWVRRARQAVRFGSRAPAAGA
jgi:hypothetical protein